MRNLDRSIGQVHAAANCRLAQPFDVTTLTNPVPFPRFADPTAAQKVGIVEPASAGMERHADGTYRTSVHPDVELVVKLTREGIKPQVLNLRLNEGEERVVEIELESSTPK